MTPVAIVNGGAVAAAAEGGRPIRRPPDGPANDDRFFVEVRNYDWHGRSFAKTGSGQT